MTTVSNVIKAHRKRWPFVTTVVLFLLCLLGLITFGKWTVQEIKDKINHEDQKESYERMVMPLVIFDVSSFDDASTLDNTTLLQSTIWSVLIGSDRDYEYDENYNAVIPASDVDVACAKLFGPNVQLMHESFGDYTLNYYYDETIKSYLIPMNSISSLTGYFTPEVETITEDENDNLILNVGYIPPTSVLNLTFAGEEETETEPAKFMEYELHKGSNGYYIYALRLISSQTIGGDEYSYDDMTQYEIYEEELEGTTTEETETQAEEELDISLEETTEESTIEESETTTMG